MLYKGWTKGLEERRQNVFVFLRVETLVELISGSFETPEEKTDHFLFHIALEKDRPFFTLHLTWSLRIAPGTATNF